MYTKEWLCRVNQGGLYEVSNETFLLFQWMELTLRKFLTGHDIDIQKAVLEIMNSDKVLSYWSIISNDLDAEDSDILLSKIANLWIVVRGFSYTGSLLEQYKQTVKESTKTLQDTEESEVLFENTDG